MSTKAVYLKLIFNEEIQSALQGIFSVLKIPQPQDGDVIQIDVRQALTPESIEFLQQIALVYLKNYKNGK